MNSTDISRMLGIPRKTIDDWRRGKVPRATSGIDESCAQCGNEVHDLQRLGEDYAYLLGVYLGDGVISEHRRKVYKLRVVLDNKYPAIIDEVALAAAAVMPANTVGRLVRKDGCTEVYSYSKSWPCLFPQVGPGKKHMRMIFLEDWQLRIAERYPGRLLRGLMQTDGCRFINTGKNWTYPRYAFHNLSADIREIFTDACDVLGVHWTSSKETIYVSRMADVAVLDTLIGPKA